MAAPGTPAAPSAAAAAGAAAAALLQRQLAGQDGGQVAVPNAGWTEHQTGDGRKFYFQEETQMSSWEKPEMLMTSEERSNNTKWAEYRIWDGRVFYYNRDTKVSCWRMPPELRKMREGISGIDDRPLPTTVAEKKRTFMALMKERGIDATWTWARVDDALADEPQAEALTEAHRKQCFAELVSVSLRARQIEAREKQKNAANALERLFEERFGKPEYGGTTYEEAKTMLEKEEAWQLIKHDIRRQEVFQTVMERLEEKHKKNRTEKRSERVIRLARFMGSDPELKRARLRWKDALRILTKRDELQEEAPALEALRVWSSLKELKPATEHEAESKAKSKPDREARKRRDAFVACVKEFAERGMLDENTSWVEVQATAEGENRVAALREGRGATGAELLDEFQEELRQGLHPGLVQKKEDIKKEEKVDGPPAKRQRFDPVTPAQAAAAAAAAVAARAKEEKKGEGMSALDAIIGDQVGSSSSDEDDDDDPLMGLANAAAAAKAAEAKAAADRVAPKIEEQTAAAPVPSKADAGPSLFEEAEAEAEAPEPAAGMSIFEEAAAEAAAEVEVSAPPAKKAKMFSSAELSSKKVDDLKALCKKHGLPISGRKQELIDRLAAL